MYSEVDPSARMQVRSRGELKNPGTCMVCGTGTCDDGYLDLGIFLDYIGTAYLCKTCVFQAGETFGMFTPDEVAQAQKDLEAIVARTEQLQTELEDARIHVDAANTLLHSKFTSGNSPSVPVSEGTHTILSVVNEPADNADSGEPVFTEPTPIERRRNSSGSKPRNPTL